MPLLSRLRFDWQLRTRSLALGEATTIMGILNVTPDSFSDGGRFLAIEDALVQGMKMLDEGAHILDIGGESTRPNAEPVTEDEEQARVLPVIEALHRQRPDAVLSIDTFHATTARAAVAAGVEIVNDVSGFHWDPTMAHACAEIECGVVLMHTRGRPQEWATLPALDSSEIVPMVVRELKDSISAAVQAGVARDRIVLDPGFGFGKRGNENYALLAGMEALRALELPVLSGTSRKGFLGATLKRFYGGDAAPLSDRGHATTAANVASVLAGAQILRVHDVRAAAEAAAIGDAILAAI